MSFTSANRTNEQMNEQIKQQQNDITWAASSPGLISLFFLLLLSVVITLTKRVPVRIVSAAPTSRRQVCFKKIYIYIYIYIYLINIYLEGCTELGSDWLVGWLLLNNTRGRRIALHLSAFRRFSD